MNPAKTSDDVMRNLKDLAKKLGRQPSKDSQGVLLGSLLDVPVTPEEEARIRRLDAIIARLEEKNEMVSAEVQPAGPTAKKV